MYHLYQTECLVIESRPHGEADRMITLFTRDFGMLQAHAKSVRLLKSKLRFSLQEFSFAEVALVRGKEMWRIVNAVPSWDAFASLRKQKEGKAIAIRIAKLLKRLLSGEEKNKELFDMVSGALAFLSEGKDSADLASFEAVFVLRVLYKLGYVGDSPTLQGFLAGTEFNTEVISSMAKVKKEAILYINKSLKETHL